MRIGSRELPDVSIEIAYRENVEARVDLTDLFLSSTRCLLFDDDLHLGTPRPFPNDPAISMRTFQIGAEQSHSRFFPQMEVAQFLDGCSRYERRIPGKHDHVVVCSQGVLRHHEGVPGAFLFRLHHEFHPGVFDCGTNTFGFVSDNRVDIAGRYQMHRRSDHMLQ